MSEDMRLSLRVFDVNEKAEILLDIITLREKADDLNYLIETHKIREEPDLTIARTLVKECRDLYDEWQKNEGKEWKEAIDSGCMSDQEHRRMLRRRLEKTEHQLRLDIETGKLKPKKKKKKQKVMA